VYSKCTFYLFRILATGKATSRIWALSSPQTSVLKLLSSQVQQKQQFAIWHPLLFHDLSWKGWDTENECCIDSFVYQIFFFPYLINNLICCSTIFTSFCRGYLRNHSLPRWLEVENQRTDTLILKN
jgi:hypothetical protein